MKIKTNLFVLLLVVAYGCSPEEKQQTDTVESYEVLELTPRTVTVYTDYPATLQGEEVIEIRPRVEGYLEDVYVDEGEQIRKGQRLFRISSPLYEQELRNAQAGIKTAEANVKTAEMNVRKTQPLVEKEIISEYELEAARYSLESSKATLVQARATLANAQANAGFTVIISPADGVIGTIPYRKGSLVSSTSTDPLTILSVSKDMYAYFSINEKQVLNFTWQFEGNTSAEKNTDLPNAQLLLADGTLYNQTGTIQVASGLIDTETGAVPFRATFTNENYLLQSGGSATVRIPHNIDGALLVPQTATYELQNKRLIYTVGTDNKVISKVITTIPTNDGEYFIVESGLKKGDKIVLHGLSKLKDSISISPIVVSQAKISSKPEKNKK
ncbi:efflux RND transporter periplasmic adaptor subunit [Empedobacter brevis]|uniref:efflux RND transporter periplasmic adaptor subunit n=1 Tax=Empedobacter brevis TaxID=247 RepID=UPI002FE1E062